MARRTKQQIERSKRIERLANAAAIGWQINIMDYARIRKAVRFQCGPRKGKRQ